MTELSLQEIKKIEFDILKMFNAFCKKHSIRLFLSNGTLLGAVKYKGFIPWDDDVDVFVPRSDYDRLIQLFQDEERYKLFSIERNPSYRFPYAKLCDMTTLKVEKNVDNGIRLGVDVDIFPLDTWDGDLTKARKELNAIQKYMFRLNLSKLKRADSHHPLKRVLKALAMRVCRWQGSNFYVKKIISRAVNNNSNSNMFVGCKVWPIYGESEIIPAKVFDDTIEVEFDGEYFPAPMGYDIYLRRLYGNYEQDPPLDKQKSHHSFVAYKL